MLCTIIGDSIAVGVGHYRPDCQVFAKVGITTHNWLREFGRSVTEPRDLVVISLGSNDGGTINEYSELLSVRAGMSAKKVIWLVPAHNERAATDARIIAATFGDHVIEIRDYPRAPDGVHPTGESYKLIAKEIE